MNRILNHNEFLIERDLSESINDSLSLDLYLEYKDINEGKAIDALKNSLDKSVFGKFSKLSVIDEIRKGNIGIEKEIIKEKDKTNDEVEKLEDGLYKERRGFDKDNKIPKLQRDIEAKRKEYNSFVKVKRAQIAKGMKILDKVLGGNPRRKEYYEAGLADDKYELAKFEYDMLKGKNYDAADIAEAKDKVEKAEVEVKETVIDTSASTAKAAILGEIKLSKITDLRKKISERDADVILLLKEKTKVKLTELKKDCKERLRNIDKKLGSKKSVKMDLNKVKGLTNEIDILKNIYNEYKKTGRTKASIDKKLTNSSGFSNILSNIKSAILKGKEMDSGLSLDVAGIIDEPTGEKIKALIKKLA